MDSPPNLRQHLGTNYIPSTKEMRQISDFLDASDDDIRDIGIEIDMLRRQWDLLLEKRSKIHDLAEQHRALISPARRLSRDILEEIFLACLPADRNPCMSATEAPMLLTQVCSSWRSIARSAPRLWSAIHIALPLVSATQYSPVGYLSLREEKVRLRMDHLATATKQWLDRSGACPLSISVYHGQEGLTSDGFDVLLQEVRQLHIKFVIEILVPYHQRWYELDVCLSAELLYNLLKTGPTRAESFKMLQKLHVARQYTGIMSSESQVPTVEWTDILCLQFNSRVTAATLQWGFNTRIPSSISSRFLGQLTELNLDLSHVGDKSVDLATVIIRQCQLLKSLKLEIFSFPDEPDVGGPQGSHSTGNIALPHLTVLSLIVTMSPEAADFVNRLYLPSLKELHLQISDYGPMNHIQLAKEMSIELLRACGDTLQSLTLYSPLIMFFLPLNPVDMMQILHLTPHLKSLKMSSFQLSHKRWVSGVLVASRMSGCQKFINDELLCALSPLGKDYSETICPQLEVLEFDYNLITAITEHGLKEFLAARRQAHLSDSRIAALQHLTVSINQLKPKEDQRENKMTLPGGNTTVYFRRPEHVEFSPWEGLELKYREQRSSAYFIQHELYS